MIPLDNLDRITSKMKEQSAEDILNPSDIQQWRMLSDEGKAYALKNIISMPVGYGNPPGIIVDWFFKTRWLEALQTINLSTPASVLEIASGGTNMIPTVLSKFYNHHQTTYTTINLNKNLTKEFKENTKDLRIKIDVIDDEGQKAETYFENQKIDAVVFEHSFNDIAEDMIAKKNGIDTINTIWWDILPKIIKLTNEAYTNGTYEAIIKDGFLQMLRSVLGVLKPGAFIISHQFHYQFDLDLGIMPEIWSDLICVVRKWINEENIGQEVFFDGFEPKWWMFIKKI
ncbi:hypothetical protein FACS1894219_11530 [Clostridia bacterium]|nr:hypothetical protein FACS1894219_11530 [Clostridia bacterium]